MSLNIYSKKDENTTFKLEIKDASLNITDSSKFTLKTKDDYHTLGMKQSNISFYYSLIGGMAGMLIIIFSLVKQQGIIGVSAGAITEIVSVLFFTQTNNARKVMTEFFDKLRADTDIQNSLDLCNSIENCQIKDRLKVKLSLHYAGIDESRICNKAVEVCCTKDIVE